MPSNKCVVEHPTYVLVDFSDGRTSTEIAAAYRYFAILCIQKDTRRALVVAGDDDATAHYALRDAFTTVILAKGIPSNFRLALVGHTTAVQAVYRLIERDFRVLGFNTQIFSDTDKATVWIQSTELSSFD